jgi:hypothetical protein
MKTYTYSMARQRLAEVLEEASREGEVQIRRQDGRVYAVTPVALSGQLPFANVTGRPIKGRTSKDLLRIVREEGRARYPCGSCCPCWSRAARQEACGMNEGQIDAKRQSAHKHPSNHAESTVTAVVIVRASSRVTASSYKKATSPKPRSVRQDAMGLSRLFRGRELAVDRVAGSSPA